MDVRNNLTSNIGGNMIYQKLTDELARVKKLRDAVTGQDNYPLLPALKEQVSSLIYIKAKLDRIYYDGIKKGILPTDDECIGELAGYIKSVQKDYPVITDTLQREIDLYSRFLPAKLEGEEMRTVIESLVAQTSANSMKEFGLIMKGVKDYCKVHGLLENNADVRPMFMEIINGIS